jgi:hypothetical protein
MRSYPEGVDYFTWVITNRGKNKLFVTYLVGIGTRLWRPRWLFARLNRTRAGKHFMFPFQYHAGSLPTEVAPLDNAAMHYHLGRLGLPHVEELYAVSADGRQWYAPRSVIRDLHADETYKKAIGNNAGDASGK